MCTHVYRQAHCVNMRSCEVGLRTRRFHILAGSVLTVWTRVENLLSSLTGSSQFRLQIIRVKTDDNQKIVGCVIPTMCLKQIDALLNSMSNNTYIQNHTNKVDNKCNLDLKIKDDFFTNTVHNKQEMITNLKNMNNDAYANTIKMSANVPNGCNNPITPVVASSFKVKNSIYNNKSIKNENTCSNNLNLNSQNGISNKNINDVIDFDKNFENINYDFT